MVWFEVVFFRLSIKAIWDNFFVCLFFCKGNKIYAQFSTDLCINGLSFNFPQKKYFWHKAKWFCGFTCCLFCCSAFCHFFGHRFLFLFLSLKLLLFAEERKDGLQLSTNWKSARKQRTTSIYITNCQGWLGSDQQVSVCFFINLMFWSVWFLFLAKGSPFLKCVGSMWALPK